MSFQDSTPKSETFYDKLEDAYDDMHFKKKKGSKGLTGV